MNANSEQLRKYFLGALPVSEVEEIELRIMQEPEFEGELLEAENDLIEDYLDSNLSDEEEALFNTNYLITPDRDADVRITASLREYAQSQQGKVFPEPTGETREMSFFERLRTWLSAVPTAAYGIGLLIAVSALIAYFLLASNPRRLEEYARLDQQDFSDLERYRNYPTVSIFPGSFRTGGAAANVTQAASVEGVLARLILPPEFSDEPSFGVRLISNQKTNVDIGLLRAYETGSGRELRVLVPAELLGRGTYQIEVVPAGRPDAPINYYLVVE